MQKAILLLGPTGSGKSPLGDCLQAHGVDGRRCWHFDFGANLRAVAAGGLGGFTEDEVAFVKEVLEAGALLENETFYLAKKILTVFEQANAISSKDLLVLNGLPRHVGQAEAMADLVNVVAVVELDCTPEIVFERLRLDTGGDRAERSDDQLELVRKKLAVFENRTQPLIAYYRELGGMLIRIEVAVSTQPADMIDTVAAVL